MEQYRIHFKQLLAVDHGKTFFRTNSFASVLILHSGTNLKSILPVTYTSEEEAYAMQFKKHIQRTMFPGYFAPFPPTIPKRA